MSLIDVLAPLSFNNPVTCVGTQHLEFLIAAWNSFRENMWEEKGKSLTKDSILINHLVHKNSIQTNISITNRRITILIRD
jgi:hypothetical protein